MDGSARDRPERLAPTAEETQAQSEPLRSELARILEDAGFLGLTVHDDGSVSYPAANGPAGGRPAAGGPAGGAQPRGGTLTAATGFMDEFVAEALGITDPNPHRAEAQHIADRIAQVVRHARQSGASGGSGEAVVAAALGPLRTRPGLDSPGPAPRETDPVRASADDCHRSGPTGRRPGPGA